jgi:hypothetical protein
LGVGGEQLQDAVAGRGDTAVVEGLQIFKGDRFALLVGHGLPGEGHA